jgi:hypothetical protein
MFLAGKKILIDLNFDIQKSVQEVCISDKFEMVMEMFNREVSVEIVI